MSTEKTKKAAKNTEVFDYRTIKSFEDACKKEGLDPAALPDVSMIPEEFRMAIINGYKLFVIYKAINNGWTPDWTKYSQYKYFPWLEVEATPALSSGFGFSYSDDSCTHATTDVGSRLCTDTSEKALYIAKTFQEEYKQYLLILK